MLLCLFMCLFSLFICLVCVFELTFAVLKSGTEVYFNRKPLCSWPEKSLSYLINENSQTAKEIRVKTRFLVTFVFSSRAHSWSACTALVERERAQRRTLSASD